MLGWSFVLCIDETGDQKYGTVTDYVSRQYIGNLGTIETGLVSVNTYGVLDDVTFPLLFPGLQAGSMPLRRARSSCRASCVVSSSIR